MKYFTLISLSTLTAISLISAPKVEAQTESVNTGTNVAQEMQISPRRYTTAYDRFEPVRRTGPGTILSPDEDSPINTLDLNPEGTNDVFLENRPFGTTPPSNSSNSVNPVRETGPGTIISPGEDSPINSIDVDADAVQQSPSTNRPSTGLSDPNNPYGQSGYGTTTYPNGTSSPNYNPGLGTTSPGVNTTPASPYRTNPSTGTTNPSGQPGYGTTTYPNSPSSPNYNPGLGTTNPGVNTTPGSSSGADPTDQMRETGPGTIISPDEDSPINSVEPSPNSN